MTLTQLLKCLDGRIEEAGSQAMLAEQLGVSWQYLNDVLYRRRMPGKKLLAALGLRRVMTFEPLDINATALHRYGLCDCGQRATAMLDVRIRNRREWLPLCDDCLAIEKTRV